MVKKATNVVCKVSPGEQYPSSDNQSVGNNLVTAKQAVSTHSR